MKQFNRSNTKYANLFLGVVTWGLAAHTWRDVRPSRCTITLMWFELGVWTRWGASEPSQFLLYNQGSWLSSCQQECKLTKDQHQERGELDQKLLLATRLAISCHKAASYLGVLSRHISKESCPAIVSTNIEQTGFARQNANTEKPRRWKKRETVWNPIKPSPPWILFSLYLGFAGRFSCFFAFSQVFVGLAFSWLSWFLRQSWIFAHSSVSPVFFVFDRFHSWLCARPRFYFCFGAAKFIISHMTMTSKIVQRGTQAAWNEWCV